MRVQLTKVLTGLSVISALCFLGDAPPAFAAPAPTCAAAIYSSGSNYCSLSAGQTITFVLKAGNGGRGGDGGMGGMGLSSGAPGGIGGAGGTGGSGGSGAKTSFTYTNTTGSTITLRFNIGVDGSAGTNGLTGGLATPGGNGGNGGDGTETAVLEGLTPIAQTSPGLGGFGGTGEVPALLAQVLVDSCLLTEHLAQLASMVRQVLTEPVEPCPPAWQKAPMQKLLLFPQPLFQQHRRQTKSQMLSL